MAIITKIDGGKQAITFNNDNEPVAVYVDGQLQESISFVPKSATGTTSVTYESEYKKNLLELDVEGNTEQKQLTGKNLFDLSKNRYSGVSDIVEKTQNSITVSGGSSWQGSNFEIPNFKDLIGKTITIRGNISKTGSTYAGLYVRWFNKHTGVGDNTKNIGMYGANTIGYVSKLGVVQAIDFEQYPDAKLCVAVYSNTNGTNDKSASITYSDIMVVEGDYTNQDLPYEEYCGGIPSPNPTYPQKIQNADDLSVELSANGNTSTVQIPSEITVNGTVVPLRFSKVGVSADKLVVDNISKKVIYKKQNHHREFTGDENWVYHATQQQGGYNNVWYRLDEFTPQGNTDASVNPQGITVGYGLSNMLYFSFEADAPMKTGWLFRFANNNGKRLYVITPPEAELDNIDKFKAFLQEKYASVSPLTIEYVEIPKEYDLTNTDLGRELLALANATQNATNVITITSSIPTSKLSVDYAEWGGKNENLS